MKSIEAKTGEWLGIKWVRFSLLVILCLCLGIIEAIRSYASAYYDGVAYLKFEYALYWSVTGWITWVAFIPLIFWICKQYQIKQNNWITGLLFYIPLGIVISALTITFPLVVNIAANGYSSFMSWFPGKYQFFLTDFLIAFAFYAFVLTLGQAINYYKRYREEELRTSQLELQLSQAQLQALKMQLHPHFLFNVLNSISALQLEDPKAAQEMTVRLGDFLRMTLENIGVQQVTLEREIEMLKCYLDIEKTRFGKRLSAEFDISPDVQEFQIPNLLLQPLVENSIKHGISQKTDLGKIEIKANREEDWVKVEIKDNGQGVEDTSGVFSSGIGLSNTKARLQQFYGENFRFDFDSNDKKGVLITLCLPIGKMQGLPQGV